MAGSGNTLVAPGTNYMRKNSRLTVLITLLVLACLAATNQYYGVFNGPLIGNANSATVASLATNALNLGNIPAQVYQPKLYWQTNHVSSYGAWPNGFGPYNGVGVTNITVQFSVLNPNLPALNSSMIGNRIIINYAGNNGQFYQGVISNVFSSTSLGLYTPIVQGLTNFAYAIICTTNSELTNDICFQKWINSVSNAIDSDLILDPPSYYTQVLGSNATSIGQCYVLETNWQGGPNGNNAMLIVPPLMSLNKTHYNHSATVKIEGSLPYRVWNGFNGYMGFAPNQSVIVIDGTGNDQTGTNFIGNSFLDGRAFSDEVEVVDPGNGPNNLLIPNNDCCVQLSNFSVIHSYDSHFVTLNLAGFADGTLVNNVELIGGDAGSTIGGLSYMWSQNHFPSGTNSIGIIPPDNTQGTFATFNYVNIYGDWAAMESGLMNCYQVAVNNCSNRIDLAYSSGLYMTLAQDNIGGCFNVFYARQNLQSQLIGRLYADLLMGGANVMPHGSTINIIQDDYFKSDGVHDCMFTANGLIDWSTNINTGVNVNIGYQGWNTNNPGVVLRLDSLQGPVYLNSKITIRNLQTYGITNTGNINEFGTYNMYHQGFSGIVNFSGSLESDITDPFFGFTEGHGLVTGGGFAPGYGGFSPLGFSGGNEMPMVYAYNHATSQYGLCTMSNGTSMAAGIIFAQNTNYNANLNGIFSIPDVTNGMFGTNYWIGQSNQALVAVGYSGGVVTFQQLMPRIATVVATNWILGGKYSFPYPVTINASAVLTVAGVAGSACLALEVNGITTNNVCTPTIVTTLVTPPATNYIGGLIPANTIFDFTNRSAGAGDSAAVLGGTYMIQ